MESTEEKTLLHAALLAKCTQSTDARETLTWILKDLDFPEKGKSGQYLIEATILYRCDSRQLLVKGIYWDIAAAVGGKCNRYQVEVAIRRAIQTAWDRRDRKKWQIYFPQCGDKWTKAPTNLQFITALSAFLTLCDSFRNAAENEEEMLHE